MPSFIITPSELKEERSKVFILDVREPEEHEEGRIEGDTLIPLGELGVRAPRELKDLNADIVVYCGHGMRSLQAVMLLRQLGYMNTRSLDGGFEAWLEQGGQ